MRERGEGGGEGEGGGGGESRGVTRVRAEERGPVFTTRVSLATSEVAAVTLCSFVVASVYCVASNSASRGGEAGGACLKECNAVVVPYQVKLSLNLTGSWAFIFFFFALFFGECFAFIFCLLF